MTRPATDPGRTGADRLADPSRQPATSNTDTKEFSRPPLDADPGVVDPGFRVGWRGYDRLEVDNYRSRVEAELASTRIAHERAAQAHAQITERLRAAQTDLGRVRGQLTNSPTALSDRLREILHLAEQDADQTRADAQTEADQIRSRAVTDAEAVVHEARDAAADIVNGARAEQQNLAAETEVARSAARQEIDSAHAEATARRSEADRQAHEQREQAQAAAASQLTEMTRQLADLTQRRDETLATLGYLHQELAKTLASIADPASEPATS
jgi:cell division septum initiation protein DivIVA